MLDRGAIAILNHLLKDADWARDRLAPFAGRRACLELTPITLDFEVQSDGYLASPSADTAIDVRIALPAGTPLLALQGRDAVVREARVAGAADFADALAAVLRDLRWDFEEDLSQIVGDAAAHRLAGALGVFAKRQQQSARNLAENVVEYLRDEQPVLPRRSDVREFVDAVDALRDDIDRLDKRIARLAMAPSVSLRSR
jgi:ubiquinone biosynthesis protein UbiJ